MCTPDLPAHRGLVPLLYFFHTLCPAVIHDFTALRLCCQHRKVRYVFHFARVRMTTFGESVREYPFLDVICTLCIQHASYGIYVSYSLRQKRVGPDTDYPCVPHNPQPVSNAYSSTFGSKPGTESPIADSSALPNSLSSHLGHTPSGQASTTACHTSSLGQPFHPTSGLR